MPAFSESEGDNGHVIGHNGIAAPLGGDQAAVIEELVESDDASVQSTGKMDQQVPGWTKRVRVGKHPPDRKPCPDRTCALEQTIPGYADRWGEHVIEPAIGLTFDSLGEADDLYNLYSWEHGFGIRYGKIASMPRRQNCMQEVVCGCSGKPVSENSRSSRCECPAMIRLPRTCDYGWYITRRNELKT